jgi:tetratricopeptide (TPR) repeat protein
MGVFGGDPVCSMEMRSEQQSYQNVIKVDANKGRRNQLINSCTESQCITEYGNAKCDPSSNEDNINPYDRGIELASNGEYKSAINYFKESVEIYPNDFDAHFNLGVSYESLGQNQNAIASYLEAMQINPDNSTPHYGLGQVYRQAGQIKEAIASYKEAIRIQPDFADAHSAIGSSYEMSGQRKEAIASFKEAIRIKPDHSIAHNNLILIYKNMDRNDEAIAEYKETLRIDPNNTVARNNLNELEQRIAKGKLTNSGTVLEDAQKHYDLGHSYGQLGQFQEAIASYKEAIRIKPDYAEPHYGLGIAIEKMGRNKVALLHQTKNSDLFYFDEAIAEYKEAIRIKPDFADAHYNLGNNYWSLEQYQNAIISYKEAIRVKPDFADAHYNLGNNYHSLEQYQNAITSYKEVIAIVPDHAPAHYNLGYSYELLGRNDEAIVEYEEAIRIKPDFSLAHNNLNQLKEERKKQEALRLAEENRQRQEQAQAEKESTPEEQIPQSGTGSGFFVSKMGHVITNAHVVHNCNRVTIGDNANKQVPAEIINTDRSNDLALLKLSTLEMASAESKSLIQKLGITVVPLASKGLLRDEDVRLGEKVLVAGYPFGELFSNTIKVTSGIVSATRGAGDDSGQFQLDAAIQPGNSGGPIYDSSGNIVGVVISQLDKLKMAKAIGTLPELVNFGIKASTVRQFLTSSGLPSKKSERTEEKSTEQLAEIAKNQALMVMCLQ